MDSAGDVNGDGFDDLIIGDEKGGAPGQVTTGAAYVVFGRASGSDTPINVANLNGVNGFAMFGEGHYDEAGRFVASAGDVNGDGFDDLLVGADQADTNADNAGAAYVVFGKASGFSSKIQLGKLDGTDGFAIHGLDHYDFLGRVSAADVNGDGLSDLIVGAPLSSAVEHYAGSAFVVFGQAPTTAVRYTGTDASQSLVGGELKDVLSGMGGDDALWGHGGKDKLTGGIGNDTLIGGAGKDVLVGSAGADVFQYREPSDSTLKAHDTIKGLGKTDLIDLHLLDADTWTDGDQTFQLVSAFTHYAGELTVSFDGKQTLVQGDTNGDATADLVIAIAGDHQDFEGLVL